MEINNEGSRVCLTLSVSIFEYEPLKYRVYLEVLFVGLHSRLKNDLPTAQKQF